MKRTVRGGKVEAHVLNVMVGGEDRTQQSIRDTQAELESLLPVAAICDGAFHGQHLVRGLLERTDVDFKKVIFPCLLFLVRWRAREIQLPLMSDARRGAVFFPVLTFT